MRRLSKFFVIAVATLWSATALAYTSPGSPSGFVNDFAGILSQETKTKLENSLVAEQQKTSNEIVVVTVPSLDDETIETYAVELFRQWGIGKKGKDNGVLLLVAPNQKQMRIEVGYGLEGQLTDYISSLINIRDILPSFRKNDFEGGISNGVASIIKALHGDIGNDIFKNQSLGANLDDSSKIKTTSNLFFVFFAIIIFFINVIVFAIKAMAGSKATWPGALGGAVIGLAAGWILGNSLIFTLGSAFIVSLIGFGIDHLLSSNTAMQAWAQKINTRSHTFWGGGGGRGGGGFGGFGGGGSGGGGSSGSW